MMSKPFNDNGYSIYGFDPLGLDRSGFDAFGFRRDGYDKDGCNWFFNGPHYLPFYFHMQQQLMSSSEQALHSINLTCALVTSLPQHWSISNLDKSSALNGQLEQEWTGQNKPENTAAAQNRSNVWIPVTPDHRYQHYNKNSDNSLEKPAQRSALLTARSVDYEVSGILFLEIAIIIELFCR